MAHPRFRKLAGKSSEGVFSTVSFIRTDPSPSVQKFNKAYEAKFNKPTDSVVAANYDGLRLIAKAIEQSGIDKTKLRETLLKMEFEGVTGKISFDDRGECVRDPFVVVIRDGNIVKY